MIDKIDNIKCAQWMLYCVSSFNFPVLSRAIFSSDIDNSLYEVDFSVSDESLSEIEK